MRSRKAWGKLFIAKTSLAESGKETDFKVSFVRNDISGDFFIAAIAPRDLFGVGANIMRDFVTEDTPATLSSLFQRRSKKLRWRKMIGLRGNEP